MSTAEARKSVQIRGYVGLNGSGKTYLGLRQSRHEKRIIRIRLNLLDPTLAKGAKVISDKKKLIKHVTKNMRKGFVICYDVNEKGGECPRKAFKFIADLALKIRFIAIFADEAHRYCDRDFEKTQPHLNALLSQGFHYRCSFYWTSTRPRQMSPEFRTQSNFIAVFDNYDPTYVGYLQSVANKSLVERLHLAPKYSYLLVSRDSRPKLCGPYKH